MNVDERKIIYRGRDAGNDKLKEIVETYSNETEGYMMCWDERYDCKNMTLEYALNLIWNDGKCMIFMIGDVCIISTEQTQGPKEIVVLHNRI